MRQNDKNIAIAMIIILIAIIAWTYWRLTSSQKKLLEQDHIAQEASNATATEDDSTTSESSEITQKEKIIPTMTAQDLHIATVSANRDIILIDTRPQEQYNANHIPGSYHIDTIDRSALSRTVVLISDSGNEDLIISLFRELSPSHEVRNLDGGIAEWKSRGFKLLSNTITPDFVSSTKVQFIEPRDLNTILQSPTQDINDIIIIDTRRQGNFAAGHVAHAINIPLSDLEFRYREIPRQKKIFVYSANEESSFQSGVLLHDLDFLNIKTIKGGFAAWEQYGYPITTE